MKVKTLIIICLMMILDPSIVDAETSIRKSNNDTIKESKDSMLIPNQIFTTDNVSFSRKEILDLLANRNSTENSLSIFITALGVLFTIMAIVIAIVIFMQSRDYKNKLKEATDKYEIIIKQFIESKRKELKIQEENLTKLIDDYREKLQSSQPDEESALKDIISKLEIKKDIVEKQLSNSVVDVNYVLPTYYPAGLNESATTRYHRCSKCDFGFLVREPGYLDSYVLLNPMSKLEKENRVATCPQCGNVDML